MKAGVSCVIVLIAMAVSGCGESTPTPKEEAAELHHDCTYLREQGVGDSYCEEREEREIEAGFEAAENESSRGRIAELEQKTEESNARVERELAEHEREREELAP